MTRAAIRVIRTKGHASMMTTRTNLLVPFMKAVVLANLFIGACSVKIVEMNVPEIIQLGGQDSVVLDCNYVMEDSNGLVVKWFFKNKTQVYQWIPTKNSPQELGILRGKLDLTYKASEDPFKSHRALRIVNPGTELSGEYTCVVSTFLAEDRMTKQMTVFVPERNFRLVQDKQQEDSVKVTCSADGMFPLPNITITTPDSDLDGISTTIKPSGGRYDAISSVLLRDDLLPSPTEFVCELRIPQANYVVKKEAIYYPGRTSAAREPPAAGTRSFGADSGTSFKLATSLLLFPLLLAFS